MRLSLILAAVIGLGATLLVLLMSALSLEREQQLVEQDIARDARLVAHALAIPIRQLPRAEADARMSSVSSTLPELDVTWTTTDQTAVLVDRVRASVLVGDRYLTVTESLQERDELYERSVRSSLLTVTVVMAVSLLVGLWIGRLLVGRRVDALVAKARRVARGQLDQPVSLSGADELSQLATELNLMAGQLKAAKHRSEKEAEARVVAEVQLRHADRLRTVGQLSAGLAHELGTPLNVVSGRAALLRRRLSDSKDLQNLDVILAQTKRISDLVSGLMRYARRSPPAVVRRDLLALGVEVADWIRPTLRGVNLTVQGDEAFASVDVESMRQVFTNLIMNAAHACRTQVLVAVSVKAGSVVLQIEDDGPGIPVDDRERVFEPFFTTKAPGEGTGIGLSVVQAIVVDHGGTLTVHHSHLGGACFRIELEEA